MTFSLTSHTNLFFFHSPFRPPASPLRDGLPQPLALRGVVTRGHSTASPSLRRRFCDRPTLDACDWGTRVTSPQSLALGPPTLCRLPSPLAIAAVAAATRCWRHCPAVVAATPTPPLPSRCCRPCPDAAAAAALPSLLLPRPCRRCCRPNAPTTAPPSLLRPHHRFCCPNAATTAPPPLPLPQRCRHYLALAAAAPTPPLRHHPASSPSLPPYG
jgi:hypothetical protein